MADIKYEIVKEIAVLSEKASGWTKEINLVSWNGRDAKYDIRENGLQDTKECQRESP